MVTYYEFRSIEVVLKKLDNMISSELAQRKKVAIAKKGAMTPQVKGWVVQTVLPHFHP